MWQTAEPGQDYCPWAKETKQVVLCPAPFCLSRLALITATCSQPHWCPFEPGWCCLLYLPYPHQGVLVDTDFQDPEKSEHEGNILRVTQKRFHLSRFGTKTGFKDLLGGVKEVSLIITSNGHCPCLHRPWRLRESLHPECVLWEAKTDLYWAYSARLLVYKYQPVTLSCLPMVTL